MKLSAKLLLTIIVGTTGVALVMGLFVYSFARSALIREAGNRSLILAEEEMDEIQHELYERSMDMQFYAGLPFINGMLKHPGRSEKEIEADRLQLRGLLSITGQWYKLFVVNLDGQIVSSTDKKFIGRSISEEPNRLAAFREAVEGRPYHSGMILVRDIKKKAIMCAYPVYNSDDPKRSVVGVMLGGLSWRTVEEIVESNDFPVALIDRSGMIIAHNSTDRDLDGQYLKQDSPLREVVSGRQQSVVLPGGQTVFGREALVSFVPQVDFRGYSSNGWGLIIEEPVDIALQSAKETSFHLLVFLLLILVVMAVATLFFLSRVVVGPIRLLTKTAQSIRSGDISKRAPVVSNDEIGDLAVTFNQMLDNLGSEKRFRAITESTSDAIISMDKEGKVVFWNMGAEKTFGYSRDEIVGKSLSLIMPESYRKGHTEGFRRYMTTRQKRVIGKTVELTGLRKNGEEFPLELTLSSWEQENDLFFTAIIRDVSEQKRIGVERENLKDQLRDAQKMEAIGRMTGGIAHDFNNLLAVINGYLELSLSGLKDDDPLKENLLEIGEAGKRAANLTRQLLAFSRKQVLKLEVVNLYGIVSRLENMLQRMIGEDIQIATYSAHDLGLVKADPSQMEQVIMNLAVNARDAMPNGGKLTIEVKNVTLDPTRSDWIPDFREGRYVVMSVSDTGIGMDAKTLKRIFEPFFTTKEKGKGTGLGLSTVHGIVHQSGGYVSAYSEPGRGTSIKVYLPRVDAEFTVSDSTPKPSSHGSLMGTETILVVEDEERLRNLVVKILRERGYMVLEAQSGEQALKIAESYEKPVDLLLTDVIMPGMNGRETAAQIIIKRPTIKILYMSGYTDDAIVHHGILEEGTYFIQKPFSPESLAQKIREVLHEKSKQDGPPESL